MLKVLLWLQTSVRNTTAPITGECCLQGKNVTILILLPFDRLFNANYLLSPELLPLVTAFPPYLCPFTTVMMTISNNTKFFPVQSMKTTSFVILRAPDLCCSEPYRWRLDSVIHNSHNVIWQSSPSRSTGQRSPCAGWPALVITIEIEKKISHLASTSRLHHGKYRRVTVVRPFLENTSPKVLSGDHV